MASVALVFVSYCILLTSISMHVDAKPQINSNDEDLDSSCWFAKEKVTKLRFYVQDMVGGKNPTVWKVAQCNLTDVLPSAFGLVSVLDNLVTYGPEMDSGELGRIQGVIGLSDFHEKALVMVLNLVFTEGDYKGSTLAILGRNPLDAEIREVPIVGGTGVFRLARGYAVTTTYAVDEAHTHGVIQYNALVLHTLCDDEMNSALY